MNAHDQDVKRVLAAGRHLQTWRFAACANKLHPGVNYKGCTKTNTIEDLLSGGVTGKRRYTVEELEAFFIAQPNHLGETGEALLVPLLLTKLQLERIRLLVLEARTRDGEDGMLASISRALTAAANSGAGR